MGPTAERSVDSNCLSRAVRGDSQVRFSQPSSPQD